jgi:integrase
MQITIGSVIKVSIRNTYLRRGQFYYQRAIPRDLRDKYPSKLIKINLETGDPLVAARKVTALDRKYEAEWTLLRADPSSSPQATRLHAGRLLTEFGIDPKARELNELALSLFADKLDDKRANHARGNEGVYRDAALTEFLSPVEVAALDLVQNRDQECLSDTLKFYLETHHKGDSEGLRKSSTIAMNGLISAVGDKPIDELSREDGRAYIKTELGRGVATGTVRRRLNSLRAIFNTYLTEREIERKNPFAGLKIAGEGDDIEERQPFTASELKTVQDKCKTIDDDPRWLLAMLSDTGARLAEVGGLGLHDIHLDADIPCLVIESRPWRTLKTKESERTIPLVGAALWAARRVKEGATKGQQFAFPRYVKDGAFNTNTASATLAKWIRSCGMDHTPHELRHTLRDRLREVQCPEEIIDAIGGWALKTVGQSYGKGYSLKVMQEWLRKVTGD